MTHTNTHRFPKSSPLSRLLVAVGVIATLASTAPGAQARPTPKTAAHKTAAAPKAIAESGARALMKDSAALLTVLGGYITCFDHKLLERAILKNDPAYANKLQHSPCIRRMGAVAAAQGYKTVTVGISGGGSFILGGFVDTGFAFDTGGQKAPTLYQTRAISIGFQAGGGVGINIGVSKSPNTVNPAGGNAHGFSFEAGAGAGAGTGIWYGYDGHFDGVSVSAIAGASGKAGAYNRINTSFYPVNGTFPRTCGRANQRACQVWERIPSCDPGLYEDLAKGMCRKKAPLRCGAKNQRPCKLWERIPSCNPGLAENFFAGRCQ